MVVTGVVSRSLSRSSRPRAPTIDGAEVNAFHRHPAGNSHVQDTHVHVGSTQLGPGEC